MEEPLNKSDAESGPKDSPTVFVRRTKLRANLRALFGVEKFVDPLTNELLVAYSTLPRGARVYVAATRIYGSSLRLARPLVSSGITRATLYQVSRHLLAALKRRARESRELARATRSLEAPHPERGIGRITMIVHDSNIDRRVLHLGRSLVKEGWGVTVIAGPNFDGSDTAELLFPDLRIRRVSERIYFAPPKGVVLPVFGDGSLSYTDIYSLTNNFLAMGLLHPAEIIVAHDLPLLAVAVVMARTFRSRLIYDAHELFPEQVAFSPNKRKQLTDLERSVIGYCDTVTTVNQSIAREMSRIYQIPIPHVVLNAVSESQTRLPGRPSSVLREKLGLAPYQRIVLYQGAFAPARNLEMLVDAAPLITAKDAVIVMMGPGREYRDMLSARAKHLRVLNDRIYFLEAIPVSELLHATSGAEIGIIPYLAIDQNTYYCTPNKLFEYIAAGVPICASDLPELRRFVTEQGFGINRELDNPMKIAGAIDEMLGSQNLPFFRENLLRERGRFLWSAQEDLLRSIYGKPA